MDSIKHKNPLKNPVPEKKIIYFWQEMIYKWTIATHLHPFIHNFHTYKYAHPPTHRHTIRHTATHFTYTTCAHLRKQAAYYIFHSIFFVWIQPFGGGGAMAETCFCCCCCFVQCNLSSHWKLLPNLTFTVNPVLHTNSNNTNHMNKSSHILVFAIVMGGKVFFLFWRLY